MADQRGSQDILAFKLHTLSSICVAGGWFCPGTFTAGAYVEPVEQSNIWCAQVGFFFFNIFSQHCWLLVWNAGFDKGGYHPQSQVAIINPISTRCRCMRAASAFMVLKPAWRQATQARHSAVVLVTNVNCYPAVDIIIAAHAARPRRSFTSCCS